MFEQTFPSTDVFPAPRGLAFAAAALLQGLLAAALLAHALLAPEVLLPPVTLAFFGAAEPPPPPPAAQERASQEKTLRTPKGGDFPTVEPPPEAPGGPSASPDGPESPPANSPGSGVGGGDPFQDPKGPRPEVPATPPVLRAFEVLPLRPLFQPSPSYPAAAAAMGLTGRVVLELLVDETGAVREARVVESTSPLFEAAALEAVRRWRYSRPVDARSGASVACLLTVTVHFRLR